MIRIAGTGRALPETCVSSEQMDRKLGLPEGHLAARTGVRQRYVCEGESQIDLAEQACRAALDNAGLPAGKVDLVLSGSAVPYQPLPATAPLVMRRLGIADGAAGAFDINSTCLGFLSAVDLAALQIAAGRAECVLVFCAEVASRALPWKADPEVAALFGDGAAAAVITKGDGLRSSVFETHPSGWEACAIGSGGTRYRFGEPDFEANALFSMDGRALFRITARCFDGFVGAVLDRAGWARSDVDVIVPHQAGPAALAHMVRLTGFDASQVVDLAGEVGNQIAASIPFALDCARRDGRIGPGAKVLMLGTSAGVSLGGMAYVA